MTLRDEIEEVLQDWDGAYAIIFRGDAPLDALSGDDPAADFDHALLEMKSEASTVIDSVERVRELVRPALLDAERAADAIEDIEGEDFETLDARQQAARNVAFLAAVDGEQVEQ